MKTVLTITILFFTLIILSQDLHDIIFGPRSQNGKIFFDEKLECEFFKNGASGYNYLHNESIISLKGLESSSGEQKYYIYIKAYNPLHYSTQYSSKLVTDSLNYKMKTAISDLIKLAEQVSGNTEVESFANEVKYENQSIAPKCLRLTKDLIRLDFKDKTLTKKELERARDEFSNIKVDLKRIQSNLETKVLKKIEDKTVMESDFLLSFQRKRIDAESQIKEETKLLETLEKLLTQIESFIGNLHDDMDDKNGWFYKLESGNISQEKMVDITLEFIEHKIEIKDDKIFQNENKTISKKHFFIRKYKLLIPEVSGGFVYADHNYSEFLLTQNAMGQNIISRGVDKRMNKFSLSAMMNFNFNIKNSHVLPFFQIGGGISEKVPIGLIGIGVRFGTHEFKNFAISTGASFTGIQQLDTLNLGDVVENELILQSDLHYKLSSPKLYLGIQYNF